MRVVIAEDNPLLRDGVGLILADHGIEVVAAVDTGPELVASVDHHRPDLALIDVRLPPTHTDEGVRAALVIRERHPDLAVLVFSQWIELTYARRLITGHRGRLGYLLKDRIISTDAFVDDLRRVAAGGTALDPDVVRQLLAQPRIDDGLRRLTRREREVLAHLAQGRSNRAVAEAEHLALRTVEKAIASIFAKLDLGDDPLDHRRVLAVLRWLNQQP